MQKANRLSGHLMLISQGDIVIHLETGETSEFILHLNFTENVKSIRIYASNYSVPPP